MVTVAGVDLPEVVARFGYLLHEAGVAVTPAASTRAVHAVALVDPLRTDEMYWALRICLVPGRAHIETFDRVFDQIFGGLMDAAGQGRNPHGSLPNVRRAPDRPPPSAALGEAGPGGTSRAAAAGDEEGDGVPAGTAVATASAAERLHHVPFGSCTAEELEQLAALIAQFDVQPPQRRSRRTKVHPSGRRIDLRATVRASQRTAGDPVRHVHRRRRMRPRRVVLLADVSGSMEAYGRAYLYLLHSAVRSVGAEAFVFSSRLSRLTRQLQQRHPAQALTAALAAAPDWAGGTRIGEALRAFNDRHGRRGLGRGAIVVIISDGWEAGDVALLSREMERLSRLAYRVIWVNPRKQRADYQPLVGGIAAALPFVDDFLSGHSVAALGDVIAAIRRAAAK